MQSDWTIQSGISTKIVVIGIACLYGNDSMHTIKPCNHHDIVHIFAAQLVEPSSALVHDYGEFDTVEADTCTPVMFTF